MLKVSELYFNFSQWDAGQLVFVFKFFAGEWSYFTSIASSSLLETSPREWEY